MSKNTFRYIDLFAGIGGFHQAMRRNGGQCVYFCEKNTQCVDVYNKNFNRDNKIPYDFDIKDRKVVIPKFDVLCAGFPCQPFSIAGYQRGFEDDKRGDLFYDICKILDEHPESKVIMLENVRNLADNKAHWDIIKKELLDRNFIITKDPIILSPHQFGIPQTRERVYILGIKKSFVNYEFNNESIQREDLHINESMKECPQNAINMIMDSQVDKKYHLPKELVQVLDAWSEFKTGTKMGTVGPPIWMSCFGIGEDDTDKFRQSVRYYDKIIKDGQEIDFVPDWKKHYIDFNRNFYIANRVFIDEWIDRYKLNNSKTKLHQKFEWNCGVDCKNIKNGITQIRQSGVRVKRPEYFPSLVAMRNIPIIWDVKKKLYRYITPHEAAKLQSFDEEIEFCDSDNVAYMQLGNAVNVRIVELLAKGLLKLVR